MTPLYSQHWDSGWFWLRALNRLGHSVIAWDYRLDVNPPPFFHYPDFILVLKGENIDPRKLPSPRVVFWPDDPKRTPGIEEVLKHYDKVFYSGRPTPKWMVWLPIGWDPAIHRDLGSQRDINTLYIGTANSEYKIKTVREIFPDIICGNEWDKCVDRPSLCRWPPQYLHDFVKIANQAKILIDVQQSPHAGVNRKFFEMIACGFTIVDRVPGVEDILGWELTNQVSFKTPEEAKELIRYYLERPKERGEVWQLEREKIREYTYERIAEKVLSFLK